MMLSAIYKAHPYLAFMLSDCLYYARAGRHNLFIERVDMLIGAYRMYCVYGGIFPGVSSYKIRLALERVYTRITGEVISIG